ncbi:hypothetical protein [Enterobacter sp. EGD-HP1]|nr:hypothetical protein [Enterobacter sp. EGD-HP1]
MALPSPAAACIEERLTIDSLCGIDGNCRVIETSWPDADNGRE